MRTGLPGAPPPPARVLPKSSGPYMWTIPRRAQRAAGTGPAGLPAAAALYYGRPCGPLWLIRNRERGGVVHEQVAADELAASSSSPRLTFWNTSACGSARNDRPKRRPRDSGRAPAMPADACQEAIWIDARQGRRHPQTRQPPVAPASQRMEAARAGLQRVLPTSTRPRSCSSTCTPKRTFRLPAPGVPRPVCRPACQQDDQRRRRAEALFGSQIKRGRRPMPAARAGPNGDNKHSAGRAEAAGLRCSKRAAPPATLP